MKPKKGCETFDNQKKNKAVKYFDDFYSDCDYNDCSSNLSADFTWKLLVLIVGAPYGGVNGIGEIESHPALEQAFEMGKAV